MASLSVESNGRCIVQVTCPDGKRRSIRLGLVSKRDGERTRDKIAQIETAARLNTPVPARVLEWLEGITDQLHKRIACTGLIEPRSKRHRPTLRETITGFCDSRKDVKESTRANWKQAHESFAGFVGEHRLLDSITIGDAEDWRQSMIAEKLREASVRTRIKNCKTLLNWAIRRGYIQQSVLQGFASSSVAGREKPYVPVEDVYQVMDHLPDATWRLILALGRFAGFRIPSEAFALRWSCIDWSKNRMRVNVPKLAHKAGCESRIAPIFERLRPYLLEAFEAAEPGEDRVIVLPVMTDAWVRKRIRQAVATSGIKPWRAIFNSLRSSCEIDLAEDYPEHVITSWIGHDGRIARRHYLRATDEHFARAAGEQAVHKAVQHREATDCEQLHQPGLELASSGMQSGAPEKYPPQDSNLEPAD